MILQPGQDPANLMPGKLIPLAECFSIECAAFAGCTQADYVYFLNAAGVKFAAWLDKNAANVAPTGALYVGADQQIEVEIVTGETAAQVATKVKAAIELNGGFAGLAITQDGSKLYFKATTNAAVVDAVSKNADDSAVGSMVVEVKQQGSAGKLYPSQDVSTLSNSPALI